MIKLVLTDDTETLELKALQKPFTETPLERATDVETLDANIHTNFVTTKRTWTHTWSRMTNSEYEALVGFYKRQFTAYKYPLLTIDFYSVSNVPVRMSIGDKKIQDHDGIVNDVSVTFRETSQLEGVIS